MMMVVGLNQLRSYDSMDESIQCRLRERERDNPVWEITLKDGSRVYGTQLHVTPQEKWGVSVWMKGGNKFQCHLKTFESDEVDNFRLLDGGEIACMLTGFVSEG